MESIVVAALHRKPVSVASAAGVRQDFSTDVYTPPVSQIFAALEVSETALNGASAQVSVTGLRFLIAEIVKQMTVDDRWYLERYPDVHAAVLAGDVASAREHFETTGFLEGRLPRPLSFDPVFYYEKYADLAGAFEKDDTEGLRRHFETTGYFEGRAGTSGHFADAERWRLASKDVG